MPLHNYITVMQILLWFIEFKGLDWILFMNCSKSSQQQKQICLPKKYLRDHRCEIINMAQRCEIFGGCRQMLHQH